MRTDKQFFDGRYKLFETDGWKDLVEELTLMSKSIDNVSSIDDEKSLYLVRRSDKTHRHGQLYSVEPVSFY